MKSNKVLFGMMALGLTLCTVALGFFLKPQKPQIVLNEVASTPKTKQSFQKLLKERIPLPVLQKSSPKHSQTAAEISLQDQWEAQCVESFLPLLSTPLQGDLDVVEVPRIGSCTLESEPLKAARSLMEQECKAYWESPSVSPNPEPKAKCLSAFLTFRASAIGWLHRNDDISKIESLGLLANILVSSGMVDVDRFEAAAYRMKELSPGMYEPVKAALIAQIMRASQAEDQLSEHDRSEIFAKLEREIEEALAIRTDDVELHEAIILARTRFFERRDLLPGVIEQLRVEGQNSPMLDYHEASALWNEGKRTQALRILKTIAKAHPEETRFQETLKTLLDNPDTKERAFSTRLSLSFDSKDMD